MLIILFICKTYSRALLPRRTFRMLIMWRMGEEGAVAHITHKTPQKKTSFWGSSLVCYTIYSMLNIHMRVSKLARLIVSAFTNE